MLIAKSLSILSLLSGTALAGWFDLSQIHTGATWTYSHTLERTNTGRLEQSYSGIQVWKIDSIEGDSVRVSWTDSGNGTLLGDAAQVAHHQAWFKESLNPSYGYAGYGFYPISGDTASFKFPLFVLGNFIDQRTAWVAMGADGLRLVTRKSPPCKSETIQYLEKWGLLHWTTSVHCGITGEDESFDLLSSEGRPYREADLHVMPITVDFAPTQVNMRWAYHSVFEIYWGGAYGSSEITRWVDTLSWSISLTGARNDGSDSLLFLRVHLKDETSGDSGIGHVGLPGDTVYQDTLRIVDGEIYRYPQFYEESCCRGLLPKLYPFFQSHGAPLGVMHEAGGARDSLILGKTRKIFDYYGTILDSPNLPLSFFYEGTSRYAQGLGMVHQRQDGSTRGGQSHDGSGGWSMDTWLDSAGVSISDGIRNRATGPSRIPGSFADGKAGLFPWRNAAYGPDGRLLLLREQNPPNPFSAAPAVR
jgi:hypothetical protein